MQDESNDGQVLHLSVQICLIAIEKAMIANYVHWTSIVIEVPMALGVLESSAFHTLNLRGLVVSIQMILELILPNLSVYLCHSHS